MTKANAKKPPGLIERFNDRVEAFLAATRYGPALFGQDAMNDRTFVYELRAGRAVTVATIERVERFMERTAKNQRDALNAFLED